jgi:hypothetical protein
MRLPALALILSALSALSAPPAAAQTYKTPQALLQALYSYDTSQTAADAPSLYSPFFSGQLNARFQDDADTTQPGDSGTIDFDPVISGNDGQATGVEVGQPIVIDDTAEVEVVIPPFLTGLCSRIHAAIFSFCAGVMPPMPILGRSLL